MSSCQDINMDPSFFHSQETTRKLWKCTKTFTASSLKTLNVIHPICYSTFNRTLDQQQMIHYQRAGKIKKKTKMCVFVQACVFWWDCAQTWDWKKSKNTPPSWRRWRRWRRSENRFVSPGFFHSNKPLLLFIMDTFDLILIHTVGPLWTISRLSSLVLEHAGSYVVLRWSLFGMSRQIWNLQSAQRQNFMPTTVSWQLDVLVFSWRKTAVVRTYLIWRPMPLYVVDFWFILNKPKQSAQ